MTKVTTERKNRSREYVSENELQIMLSLMHFADGEKFHEWNSRTLLDSVFRVDSIFSILSLKCTNFYLRFELLFKSINRKS